MSVIVEIWSDASVRGYLGITVHYVESGKSKNVVLGGPRFKGKLGSFSWAVIKLVLFQTANIDLFSGTPIDLQITLLLVYLSILVVIFKKLKSGTTL